MKALQVIRGEHRALAAVLHGLQWLVLHIRSQASARDLEVLAAMVYYIDAFPERFHHPKEDRYLFALLRARCPAAAPVLDALAAEHEVGAQKVRLLEQALTRFAAAGACEHAALAAAVDDYVAFEFAHMRREERDVLPLAEAHLLESDWQVIDDAFTGHADPLLGTAQAHHWDQLFSSIVALAPAPIGLGAARTS